MIIIDACTYFQEADLLALRIETLRDVVDRFVVVESNVTHAGAPKPYHGYDQRDRFEALAPGRVHFYPAILPEGAGLPATRRREMGQRNAIASALAMFNLPGDALILISDVDEIPHPQAVAGMCDRGLHDGEIVTFRQHLFYYNLNTSAGMIWNGTRAARYADMRALSPHIVRYGIGLPDSHYPIPLLCQPGGWHLSYFGGPDAIRAKMTSFLHQELVTEQTTDRTAIAWAIANGADVWGRTEGGHQFTIGLARDVPPPVAVDPARWASLFHPDYAPRSVNSWPAMEADSGMEGAYQ